MTIIALRKTEVLNSLVKSLCSLSSREVDKLTELQPVATSIVNKVCCDTWYELNMKEILAHPHSQSRGTSQN